MENSTWENSINPTDFVRKNITPYDGDESFLTAPTPKTQALWKEVKDFLKQELESGGILDIDTETISTITSHEPGYIDRENEVIIGLQTDAPLKRAIKPFGGVRVVEGACLENGRQLSERVKEIFTKYRKSHNDGVFSAYTEMMLKLRKTGILTGLPDAYARGRIIGDYRRVALYGVDRLIQAKEEDRKTLDGPMTDDLIRLREEVVEQIKALNDLKKMAESYGVDISKPAQNSHEAVQWTYFAYLASVKEQDGAAMSLGNVCAFFDIYIEKDLDKGMLTEEIAQELVDQFVMKLRIVRHLRPNAYNELFAGDPTWITEAIGGTWNSGQHKVTKTAYRFLHTLYNLGPAPEPNITILWSKDLPENFKKFCAKVSIETSSIQYENDDLMREISHKDDYGIACCVSRLTAGQQMQFFGARCNIAKTLLLALNEGKDEKTGIQIIPDMPKVEGEYLDYATVRPLFDKAVAFLMQEYAKTMNVIHYMHDKYYYENIQMALLDTHVDRLMAFGIAGLSVVTDSLSAIKNAKVKVIRDENGLTKDFQIEGDFPKYGNDKDEVDNIAKELVHQCHEELSKHHIYRGARPTLSVLTITSNVVYGHKTGATPDGRKDGEPFAPGANPMHGRDTSGAIASLNSVAKIDYKDAEDGISNTFSITPQTLGATPEDRISNLAGLLDGYFAKHAHHLNVNVMNRETLIDAMNHPENYPQLTIRVSGYAVNFVKLSREQQQEVLARTFFEKM